VSFCVKARLLVFIACLMAAAAAVAIPHTARADDPSNTIARRARDILSQRCYNCHGKNGVARKNVFVLDRDRLVSSRTVIPGDSNSLLIKMVESNAMPLGGPALTDQEKAALRSWVTAGAPVWEEPDARPAPRTFITEQSLLTLIRDDLLRANERARPYLRYFSIAHLYNSGAREADLEVYRVALAKLINSLSWQREITQPAPVDAAKTLLRVDLRDYNWTAATWNTLLAAYPYGIRTQESELITVLSDASLPYVWADWFVANASLPPLYHNLLGLPVTISEIERILGVDAARNLGEEKNVLRAGVRTSGVSHNNRVLERHAAAHGAYWKSFDFRSNLDDQNIFRDPVRLNPAGGEIIFNLPNGLQAYFLANGQGRRLDSAPIEIVADRNNPDDPIIQNGRSCMSCHYAGVQPFKDEVRAVISRMTVGLFDRDRALALYPPQEAIDLLIEKDQARFKQALAGTGASTEGGIQAEPINAVSRRFLSEIEVERAAAEVGMKADEFQARVRRSARLVALGFGQLLVDQGGFKRDAWERQFGELARELGLGLHVAAPSALLTRTARAPAREAARVSLVGADRGGIMRGARSIFVISKSVFLKSEQLEQELSKRPEFQSLGLVIVRDEKAADIRIEINRPPFTFIYAYTITHPATSVLLVEGKVTAFDGSFAAPKIAKEFLKQLQAVRSN
jgi:mono/diheme cytochrome c family protein